MNIRRGFISVLLRTYPAPWRREYGDELVDLLGSHPLGARVVADVLWNGVRQRLRSPQSAMVLGLAAMLGSLTLLVANVVAPQPYGGWTTVLEPSSKTFPSVRVSAVAAEVFCLLFVACGWWTYRRGGTLPQAGRAAAAVCLLAGVPVMVTGALLLLGALGVSIVGPGHSAGVVQHRLTFTYYSPDGQPVSPLMVMLYPLSRVPIAWLWGSVGGYLARWTAPDPPGRQSRTT